MKRLAQSPLLAVAAALWVTPALCAAGPGTLYFNNRVLVAGLDAPVFDVDCQTPLGEGFVAQLYVGLSPDTLVPVGTPVPFRVRDGQGTGYVNSADPVNLPLPAGSTVWVQLRAWEPVPWAEGESWPPLKLGWSKPFTVVAGGDTGTGPPRLPADLVGLESFCVQEVPQPPRVRITPDHLAIFYPGESVTFTAHATGTAPLAYQWRRNGVTLPGAQAPTLTLPGVGPEEGGEYTVVVANSLGTAVSAPATLRWVAPPPGPAVWFANRAPGLEAPVYDTDCRTPVQGTNFVAQLWLGPTADTLQPLGAPQPFSLPSPDGGSPGFFAPTWLEAPDFVLGRPLLAQVRVWDAAGAESFTDAAARGLKHGVSELFQVQPATGTPPYPPLLVGLQSFCLGQAPIVVRSPASVTLYPGEPLRLEVEVDSALPVTYQWFRNGAVLPGATRPQLEFAQITPADAGDYTVTVANRVGSVTTPPARLTVLTPTGGGTVFFANEGAPILEADGSTPLSGQRYRAELLAGPAPDALTPTGIEAPFQFDARAGHFSGGTQPLSNVPPNTEIWVQVRAWDAFYGASFEVAAAIGRAGQSEPFTVVTGGFGLPAGQLSGLKTFRLAAAKPPLILQQPPEFYWVIEGAPILYLVKATNYLSVYWERSTPKGWVTLPGANDLVLSFAPATAADAGEYRAVLVGPYHQAYSSTATLQVGRVLRAGNGQRGRFTLRVAAEAGPEFDLEGSTNLADWSVLLRLTHPGAALELTETPQARPWPNRFYRLRSVRTGQVSSDIAGFVEVQVLPGFSLVGLPLIPPSPRVADLLAGLPVDTIVYKYDPDGRGFTINTLWDDGWSTPEEELHVGEACLLVNPTSDVYRLTLHGTVPTGELVRPLPAGWSLQALPLPWVGRLDTDLACPLQPREIIARWDAQTATLRFAVRAEGAWLDRGTFQPVAPPALAPGEGFWIWKHVPEDWRLSFEPEP